MPLIDPKSPWASKTLWINGLTLAVTVLTVLSGMSDKLPPQAMPWIVGALALANFGLRFLTDSPLKVNP